MITENDYSKTNNCFFFSIMIQGSGTCSSRLQMVQKLPRVKFRSRLLFFQIFKVVGCAKEVGCANFGTPHSQIWADLGDGQSPDYLESTTSS